MTVPLVWPRILLAGMLPFFLSLGLGLASQPGDLIVFVGGVEWGIRPYWPDFATQPHVKINIREPLPQGLAPLQPALDRRPPAAATLLIYREDLYLSPRRAGLDEILHQFSSGAAPAELWNRDAYHLLRFAPRP